MLRGQNKLTNLAQLKLSHLQNFKPI